MTAKFISLATGIVTLDVYLQSQLHSNDPLFWLISNSLAVNILMVLLAALAIEVSLRKRFSTWSGYAAVSTLAVLLIIIGASGLFFSGFIYSLWTVLLPLNYLLILGYGVVLGICALSYQHQPKPDWARLPRLAPLFRNAIPVPKISHFPLAGRPTVRGSS